MSIELLSLRDQVLKIQNDLGLNGVEICLSIDCDDSFFDINNKNIKMTYHTYRKIRLLITLYKDLMKLMDNNIKLATKWMHNKCPALKDYPNNMIIDEFKMQRLIHHLEECNNMCQWESLGFNRLRKVC